MEKIEHYWRLTFKDGEEILIKPGAVAEIKRQIKEERSIVTADWTRNLVDYRRFEKTSMPYIEGAVLLPSGLEEAARAFKQPLHENDAVLVRWVKRAVTKREWGFYSKIPGYRFLSEAAGGVYMAFRLPIHEIDNERVTELMNEEIEHLY